MSKKEITLDTYFTADMHFDLEHTERNELIISKYNGVVKSTDIVYFIGDFSDELAPIDVDDFAKRLNGKKILIRGNHDKHAKDYMQFEDVVRYEELCCGKKPKDWDKMTNREKIESDYIRLQLGHYPQVCWKGMNNGSYMLHGHIHSTGSWNKSMLEARLRQYDVGIMANEYKPVKLKTIVEFFKDREILELHGREEELMETILKMKG